MNPRKNFFRNTPETPGQMGQNLTLGSNPRYLRILASDLELIQTCLEPTPTGTRLHIESEPFKAILPASGFILTLLARKLHTTTTA